MNEWPESATSNPATHYASINLHKASDKATSFLNRQNKTVKKKLLPELCELNKLAASRKLNVSRKGFYFQSQKGRNPKLSKETISNVLNSHNSKEIVTVYPTKLRSGKIIKILKLTCKQIRQKFLDEHPWVKIGQTAFNRLKPIGIKLMRHAKSYQCLCDVCDNVSMLLSSIKQSMLRSGMASPIQFDDLLAFTKTSVCDLNSVECVERQCSTCNSHSLLKPMFTDWLQSDDNIKISYMNWTRVSELVNGKTISKIRKVEKTKSRADIFTDLLEMFVNYPSHLKNAVSQLKSYKKCKMSLRDDEVLVVVDFAENYVCKQYAEAQSAYYSRNSVTLHPMVAIFSQDSDIIRDSVVVISEDLRHDSSAVKVFIQTLAYYIQTKHPHINHLIIWSDGCSSQYKSRQPMNNIAKAFCTDFKVTWNFFGSRHGKGEADGESAVVKNYLDTVVRSQ